MRGQALHFKAEASQEDLARILSCSTLSSRSAFTVLPHPHRGTYMNPCTWRYSIALRLGLPIFSGTSQCPTCRRRSPSPAPILDKLGNHALLCRYEDGVNRRHNGLRDFFCYRILKPLGLVVYREYPLPRLSTGPTDQDRPLKLDLFIPPSGNLIDRAQGLDFTIAHPLTPFHVAAASRSGEAAASNLERSKHRSYGAICEHHNITLNPIGFDIFGALGSDAIDFIKRLSIFMAERRGSSPKVEEQHLYERSTVALHSLQSRMINTRLVA